MRWEEIEIDAEKQGISTDMVLREEVQKSILTSLSLQNVFSSVVLQGGTALRLFYDNPRFSEYLDLAVREKKDFIDLEQYIDKVERFVSDSYPFLSTVDITVQKKEDDIQRYIMRTSSEEDEQKVRIHLEFFDVPSHRSEPKILKFPPINPAVRVEGLDEILSDKITALGGRDYIKGRDLWDLYFLCKQKGIELHIGLVKKKVEDYGLSGKTFSKRLDEVEERLDEEGEEILERELKRFLAPPLYQQYEEDLDKIIDEVVSILKDVKNDTEWS